MPNLTARWPLGLTSKNWPNYVTVLVAVLFVLMFFDAYVSQSLMAWPDIWRGPFYFLTDFGLSDWVLIPSLIVMILALIGRFVLPAGYYRRASWELTMLASFIFVGVGGPGLLANGLKRLFGRGRPAEFLEHGAFAFRRILNDSTFQSFPSGHSTTAMATALVVGFVAPKFFQLFLLIAVMTGFSRIVIGMHYPTDVVAGFALGCIGAYAVRNFFAARRWLFARLPDGTIRFRGVPNLRRVWRLLTQRA